MITKDNSKKKIEELSKRLIEFCSTKKIKHFCTACSSKPFCTSMLTESGSEPVKPISPAKGEFSEWDTIIGFLCPLLDALGWEIPAKVGSEVHFHMYTDKLNVERVDNPDVEKGLFDCLLSVNGNPYALFEVKPLSKNSSSEKEKTCRECDTLKCKIAVVTNLLETVIYDGEGKEVAKFSCPSDYVDKFDELWKYMSRDCAEESVNTSN